LVEKPGKKGHWEDPNLDGNIIDLKRYYVRVWNRFI
jgi:hypothetical protein